MFCERINTHQGFGVQMQTERKIILPHSITCSHMGTCLETHKHTDSMHTNTESATHRGFQIHGGYQIDGRSSKALKLSLQITTTSSSLSHAYLLSFNPPLFSYCSHVTLCRFCMVYKTVKFGESHVTKAGRAELFLKRLLSDIILFLLVVRKKENSADIACAVCCCLCTFIKNNPPIITSDTILLLIQIRYKDSAHHFYTICVTILKLTRADFAPIQHNVQQDRKLNLKTIEVYVFLHKFS